MNSKRDQYQPLDTSGNDYAGMVGMSELDRAALEAAQKSWNEADAAGDQAAKDAAHMQAETIRSQYSYSGGSDGSQYLPTGMTGKFNYQSAPQYVNKYQGKIDDLTAKILGREAFSYDPEKDSTFQQYKESYTRNGQRAMQDTLGQVSARTGGLASSYAGTAAQQTYDGYMSALADKIPELKQLAYQMYKDEGTTQRANLEMLQALESGDYNKYLTLLSQYNNDRSFDYGIFRDQVGDRRTAEQDALERAQLAAKLGDDSQLRELLGVAPAEVSTKQKEKQENEDDDRPPTDPLDFLNWKVEHGLMTKEAAIKEAMRLNGEVSGSSANNAYNEYLIQQALKR